MIDKRDRERYRERSPLDLNVSQQIQGEEMGYKGECRYCQAEITSPYDIPITFCPDKDCKLRWKQQAGQEKRTATCNVCSYTWILRREGKPARCARCLSLRWDSPTQKGEAAVIVCQRCGKLKKVEMVYCEYCRTPRGEVTYRCGLTLTQYAHFRQFLLDYVGTEPLILAYRKALEEAEQSTTPAQKESEPGTEKEVVKEQEVSKVEPQIVEPVEEERELTLDEQLALLDQQDFSERVLEGEPEQSELDPTLEGEKIGETDSTLEG